MTKTGPYPLMQYPLIGGAINTGSPSAELAVSDIPLGTGILDTTKVFTLRCAMDSTGNLAFCWNLHDCAHAVILANRNPRAKKRFLDVAERLAADFSGRFREFF